MGHDTYETDGDERHGDHQLLPVKGGRYVKIFRGPEGTDVGDLHTEIEPVGGEKAGQILVVVHSGWKPNEEHIAQLEAGAHVRLSQWIYPIPPVAMSIEPPVCACHGNAMDWDPDDKGYYCASMTIRAIDPADPLDRARADFTPQQAEPDED
jgi:hypothetical protein